MRIANIIIAHKNPDQLLRLINQYGPVHFHNYVHIDAKVDIKAFSAVANHPNVTLLPRLDIVWAGYKFVKVAIDALRQISTGKEKYQYFNLMSGMDFPLRPVSEFVDYLEKSYNEGPKEFLEVCDLSVWPGKHRYERFHLSEWTIKGRYFIERIINWFVPKRKFWYGKMEPYGYSCWYTVSDKYVDYVLNFIDENPDFIKFLKTTWSPDEFMWCSLIMHGPLRPNLGPGNLRHIDWSEKKVNPKLFKTGHLEELLASGKFIGRKFDESVDEKIITQLEKVINQSQLSNLKS